MDEIANRLQTEKKWAELEMKTKGGNKGGSEEMMGAVSVTAMADILAAKFKSNQSQPPPEPIRRMVRICALKIIFILNQTCFG